MAPQINDPSSTPTDKLENGTEVTNAETGEVTTPLDVAEEFDGQERSCILYRYCRPVENGWLNNLQNDGVKELPEHLQHWALVAHFPRGNRYMLFEATEHEGTKLMLATISHLLWSQDTGVTIHKLAKVTTSPKRLLELAKSHPLNGSFYSVTFNNCQEWFKIFYKLIQDDQPSVDTSAEIANMNTFLDNAVVQSGRVGGLIVAGFWDVVKRLTGGLLAGSVRVPASANASSVRPSSSRH